MQDDASPGSVVVTGRALFPIKTVTLGVWSGLSKPTRGGGPGWPWGTDSHSVPVDQSGPAPHPRHSAVGRTWDSLRPLPSPSLSGLWEPPTPE